MGNKKQGGKWASDEDAGSLLAGILDDTETAAAKEEAALKENIDAKRERERTERELAEQRRAEATRQRLEGEAQRQKQLAERRTARMQAIQIEDLKANGQWVDPAEERAVDPNQGRAEHQTPLPEEMQAQLEALQERMAELQNQSTHPDQAPVGQTNEPRPMLWLALAAAIIAVLGGSAVLGAMSLNAYSPDQTSYAKVTLQPKDERQLITQVGIEAIKPEPAVVAEPEKPKAKRPYKPKSSRPAKTPKPEKPKKPKFDLDLDSSNIFGEGP